MDMYWEMPTLTSEDLDTLAEVPGVKAVIGTNQGWGTLLYNENQGEMQITGVGEDYFKARKIPVVEGRSINSRDNDSLSRVTMIDTVARKKFFKETDEVIGEIIDLNGNPYKVIGVYESPIPEQFRSETGEMLMPRAVISMMFGSMEIESLSIIASNPEKISETGRLAADTLTNAKKLENGMYNIHDFSEYEKEVDTVLTLMTLVIGSIAGEVCGDEFVSVEQSSDVVQVLGVNDIDFNMEDGFNLAELCLPCRRKYRISRFSGFATHQVKVKEANQNAKG
jgi:putative ABC transport system permease protein